MDVGKIAFWTANIVALLALPFLLLVGTVLFLVSGGGWNALGHAANLVLVAYVVIIAAVAITPRVPFSTPPAESREISSRNFVRDLAGWSLALLLLPPFLSAASSQIWSAVCLAMVLIAVVALLRQVQAAKGKGLGGLLFEGL